MAYLPLSTANLPDPAIDPAQGSSPEDYFNTVLYTGDGTASRSITGVGFQPDFVWHKSRSDTRDHRLLDAVRGATLGLSSNLTIAEYTESTGLTSFASDGFNIGNAAAFNTNAETYVAWNWKANGSGVSNTDGTITSTVSANTESGFSIVSYTGTGSAATVGHGLDSAPEMIIVKSRNDTDNWLVYHVGNTYTNGSPEDSKLRLNTTGDGSGGGTPAIYWNSTAPTSTVFSVGTNGDVNQSTELYIAYCFHSVEGFSKFGSYTGNGSADGPFVYTGFRPAFLIVKRTTSTGGEWTILDVKRDIDNIANHRLFADLSDAESTSFDTLDILSNGFKLRNSNGTYNGSGDTYIYMAFAEMPTKFSLAR